MSGAVLIRLPCGLCTLIDAEDADRVLPHYWNAYRHVWMHRLNHYVAGRVDGRQVTLHRFLLPTSAPLQVDHINNDGLDNRLRVNLRQVTRSENVRNRSFGLDAPLSLGWLPRKVPILDGRRPWQGWHERRAA